MTPRPCPVCGVPGPAPLFEKDGFHVVRCASCTLVFVGEDPATIHFESLYGESYYRGGRETAGPSQGRTPECEARRLPWTAVFADYTGQEAARRAHARRKLWWLRHVPPRLPSSGRLLDVGCAAGFFLTEARTHYDVQGVELSAWSSAHARERFGLPVATGTLHDARLPADHFDIVTLWDVIEHVPDPVSLLAEAARVMKPGAQLVLTTGDWGSAYAQKRGAEWHLMTPPWHLTMFSRVTLAEAARRAGLRVHAWRSEGVGGDGRWWRSRAGLALSRVLGRGDIVRLTLRK